MTAQFVVSRQKLTNYITGARWNIIFDDLKPEKGYRILMDGLPGVIASDDDFGVNSNGIMVTETTITQFFGFDPNGKPEFFRARKTMQDLLYELKTSHSGFRHFKSQVRSTSIPAVDLELFPTR